MNGPSSMYKLKPIIDFPRKIDLPDCMYKLKNPVECVRRADVKSTNSNQQPEVLTGIMDKEPVPGLESLEARWDSLIQQLSDLKLQMTDIRKSIGDACKLTGYTLVDGTLLNNLKVYNGAVVNANPSNPPYSLLLVKHLIKSSVPVIFSNHVHSSVASVPNDLQCFNDSGSDCSDYLKLHLIWKSDLQDTELITNPIKQLPIRGEVNILRLLGRSGLDVLAYPDADLVKTVQMDAALDVCHRLVHSSVAKEKVSLCKTLSNKLGKMPHFGGASVNIIDIAAWSAVKQASSSGKLDMTPSLTKWYQSMDKMLF